MTDAQNIYSRNKSASVSEHTLHLVEPQTAVPKKSIMKRLADFLIGPDLDLESYQRLEGLAGPREQDAFQRWRDMGGRF